MPHLFGRLHTSLTFRKIVFRSWGSALFVACTYSTCGMDKKKRVRLSQCYWYRAANKHSTSPFSFLSFFLLHGIDILTSSTSTTSDTVSRLHNTPASSRIYLTLTHMQHGERNHSCLSEAGTDVLIQRRRGKDRKKKGRERERLTQELARRHAVLCIRPLSCL